MGFNMIAAIRGPHFEKTAAEVAILAEPLATFIDQQDNTTKKLMEKYMLPISILFGLFMVLQEPIRYEIEAANIIAAEKKRGNSGFNGARPVQAGAAVFTASSNGNGIPHGPPTGGGNVVDIPTAAD